jgi:S-(hydroxymethyl)glutathione dehydrogenase/alcohol dehydrogenase
MTNLCDLGRLLIDNSLPDGTYRYHEGSTDFGQMCLLGTFSQYAVFSEASTVKVDDDLPFDVAALVGCGVPTGFGTAVNAGEVRPGDTTVVYGVGGVGINSVQGAAHAGARCVVAVDPVAFKRESALKFGATHAVASAEEAAGLVLELTEGVGADQALITMGVVTEEVVSAAFDVIRKRGIVVITGLANPAKQTVHISGSLLTLFEKRIQGALFGSSNPFDDIPRILGLYKAGKIKLDELITTRYTLDQVNQGYEDMMAGRNLRGVIIHEH